jgi:hypothetical protein
MFMCESVLYAMYSLSCARTRCHAAAVALPRTRLSFTRTFIALVYSQFELKSKLQFFIIIGELINLIPVTELFRKSRPPPELPKPTNLMVRRHHGLRTCVLPD